MSAGQQTFARFNIVAGTNGTGKSTFVEKIIEKSAFRNAIVYIEDIDTGGAPFSKYPVIGFADYKGGKVRMNADNITLPRLLTAMVNKYRNGILVVDEAGLYELFAGYNPIEPLKHLLKQRRKFNIEIYFLYHGVSEVPVRLFKWCNNVILFHQTDEFKHKAAVIPRLDDLRAAQLRIRNEYFSGKIHYAERIQLS